jgi:hypothetical protein
MCTFNATYDEPNLGAEAIAHDRARKLLGQVMGNVVVTVGFAALGAYLGRDLEPLRELVNIELIWAGQPPTTPSAAAVAAGFALTPEVVAVLSATCTAGSHRSTVEMTTDSGSFSEPF